MCVREINVERKRERERARAGKGERRAQRQPNTFFCLRRKIENDGLRVRYNNGNDVKRLLKQHL